MVALDVERAFPSAETPGVRRIDVADLRWALRAGWDDFMSKRGDLIFAALFYPLVGLIAAFAATDHRLLPLFFPLVAGLSIMGPLVASGFYEIARRREQGDDAGWAHFLDPLLDGKRRAGLLAIASMLIVLFLMWLLVAWTLYQMTVGRLEPHGPAALFNALVTTREGWTLMICGNVIGAVIAAVTLVATFVSVPMVVDKPVSGMAAVLTSIRAASMNPGVTVRWGLTVAFLLVIGTIPLFIGLAVVLPVLGYATWHLYTRAVER